MKILFILPINNRVVFPGDILSVDSPCLYGSGITRSDYACLINYPLEISSMAKVIGDGYEGVIFGGADLGEKLLAKGFTY